MLPVTSLSLRQRFVLIALLAMIAIGAAALAMAQLLSQSEATRERAALQQATAALEQLAARLGDGTLVRRALDEGDPRAREELGAFVQGLLQPLGEASAGVCSGQGKVLLAESGPLFHGIPFGALPEGHGPDSKDQHGRLLPADRAAVERACASRAEHTRVPLPRDLLLVSTRPLAHHVAWTILRLPPIRSAEEGLGWGVTVGFLGLASVLLVLLAADALVALRRGAADLETGLRRFQEDLRAQVPQPRTRELARIADGLRAMAVHLAEAQDRERALARKLGHEQRLAGLGRVVAGVAHEVRNPLTGLKLKLDGMARRRLDERTGADVATCLQEIARLDKLVSTLLLVARKAPSAKSRVELGRLVDERLRYASALAAPRGVACVRQGEAEAWGNEEELARVLDNLLRNAVEASPDGATVEVRIDASAGQVRLTVADAGPGIPEAREGELFEPFFTLKATGTGLGLFLSRAIAEAHGGGLDYERVGASTLFHLHLEQGARHAEGTAAAGR